MFSTRKRLTNTLKVDNEKITKSTSVKYLGVTIDSKLKFDREVKKILQRMACGIKVLNTLSKSLTEKTKILLFNAKVMSSTLFRFNFDRVSEKQLNWGKPFLIGENTICQQT